MSQFTALTFAMLAFVEAHGQLDIAAKQSGRIPEPMRVSAFSLSQDITEGVKLFQTTHDETAKLSAGPSNVSPDEGLAGLFSEPLSMDTALLDLWRAQHQLVFAYRVMFYVVRAYQDPVYQVLRICESADPRKGSMSELLEAGANDLPKRKTAVARAVRRSLESGCPEYLPWFKRWRDTRNRVKEGLWTPHADSELGIAPQYVQDDGTLVPDRNQPAPVRFDDVVEAVEMSAALARFTRDRLAGMQATA